MPDLQHQFSQELTIVQRTPKLTWIGGVFFYEDHNEGQVEITVFPIATQIRPFAKIGTMPERCSARLPQLVAPRFADGGSTVHGGAEGSRYHRRRLPAWDRDPDDPDTFYDFVERRPTMPGRPRSASRCRLARHVCLPVRDARFQERRIQPRRAGAWEGLQPGVCLELRRWPESTLAGGRVRANTALFYSDYQDLQVQSFLRPGVPDISNAASATIRGIEFEVAAATWHGMQLSGTRLLARGVV